MSRLSIQEMMNELDKREAQDAVYADTMTGQKQEVLFNSPRYTEIRAILNANPILVRPCLAWLKEKLAAIANAQLITLYTPEQIESMKEEIS